MAAGIFLRIWGGVGRLREKTELSKYAAASGAGMGWGDARRDGTARSGGGRVGAPHHKALRPRALPRAPRAPNPARPPGDN
ncbi:MAG: hypothetical protein ACFN1A_10220 [Corynebacterium matruchotii]|uniref:hypothetical protein n=1 Tax=Corynebacterium matruchotii TaxID=43768 RepID=UPI0036216060